MRPLQVQLVREPNKNPGPQLGDRTTTANWIRNNTDLATSDREMFICLHLNVRHHVISWEVVSMGTLTAAIVHPREVFKAAILSNAAAVIVAHNHPSGDTSPSNEDFAISDRLRRAGEILGIELIDHLVITHDNYATCA